MTRNKKDIESLFRESEHKLTERPSSQAWRKLERKLDNRRGRHRIGFTKYLSMAAALVALIAVIWAFSSVIKSPSIPNSEMANFEQEIQVEELVNVDNSKYNRKKVDEYMKKFASMKTRPAINEGNKEKELRTVKKNI